MIGNKTAILGGTFDPIHNGHIEIAKQVIAKLNFDKVIFIPNKNPPHRNQPIASSEHRLKMLQLAINNNKDFDISTCELDRDGPSYMVDTIEYLTSIKVNNKPWLIIGQDAFDHLPQWHNFERLIKLCGFIVITRHLNNEHLASDWLKNYNIDMIKLDIPPIDISSTEIRKLLKNHRNSPQKSNYLNKTLPKQVVRYIQDNNLYS